MRLRAFSSLISKSPIIKQGRNPLVILALALSFCRLAAAQDPYLYHSEMLITPEVFDFQHALATDVYPFIGSFDQGQATMIKAQSLLEYAEKQFGPFTWLAADAALALAKVCAFSVDEPRRAWSLASRAERTYREHFQDHPRLLSERLVAIAGVYQQVGHDKEARALYAEAGGEAVQPDPLIGTNLYWDTLNKLKWVEIELNRGEAAFLIEDYAAAESAFIKAMSLLDQIEDQAPLTTHPHFAMYRLIETYEKQKKLHAAEELYRQALLQWEGGKYGDIWLEKILKSYQRFLRRWWRWDEARSVGEKLVR